MILRAGRLRTGRLRTGRLWTGIATAGAIMAAVGGGGPLLVGQAIGGEPRPVSPRTPFRSADFTQTVGVQVHLNYNRALGFPQSPYADHAKLEGALAYLRQDGVGITTLRDTAFYAHAGGYLDEMYRLGRLGYRWDLFVAYDPRQPSLAAQYAAISGLVEAGHVALVEGALEVDNPAWGMQAIGMEYQALDGVRHVGWGAVVAVQRDLQAAVAGRVPVALWSIADPGNGEAGGAAAAAALEAGRTIGALCDWGNVHFYQHGGFSPGNSTGGELHRVISQETGVTPDKPFAITETGFNDLPVQDTGYLGTPAVNARYVLNLILDAFQAGSRFTVLYELFDEHVGAAGKSAFEDHWGLFGRDGKPKPAAFALSNFLRVVGDAGAAAATFVPKPLDYAIANMPAEGRSLLLGMSSGRHKLIIWSDANLYAEGRARRPVVTKLWITFKDARPEVRIYDPVVSKNPVQVLHDVRRVAVKLSDRPLVVDLAP